MMSRRISGFTLIEMLVAMVIMLFFLARCSACTVRQITR